jgi:hypothetical protein
MGALRNRLEVADSFFRDSRDYLWRYELTWEHFSPIKSSRYKLFIDLRSAYECILKAHLAYSAEDSASRKCIIQKLEVYNHNIDRLFRDLVPFLPKDIEKNGEHFNVKIVSLPISLRYCLDGRDFLDAKEDLYYSTIGQDSWMGQFAEFVTALVRQLDEKLQAHSKIVSSEEAWEILNSRDGYNKYAPKRDKPQ